MGHFDMISRVNFGSLEAFSTKLVGASQESETIITLKGRALIVPARLRGFLRFWFAAEVLDVSPCGFAILDPSQRDCRDDLQTAASLLWWGSWFESARVRDAIDAIMADEQLPGRWVLDSRRGPERGLVVLRDDRRGRAARPRGELPAQPRRSRARPLEAGSKYDWETHRPGERRIFENVTSSALHSHFRAWARRRGVSNRAIQTRTVMPGVVSVEMMSWHGGDDALAVGAPAATTPAPRCPHCGGAL